MKWLSVIVWLIMAMPVWAEQVVLGLSQDEVAITATFDGSDLLIFGAIKREEQIPTGPPLQVIVTVAGPSLPTTVRRKSKHAGIWVNTASADVAAAPVFYAVATSAPFDRALHRLDDILYKVSVPQAIRAVSPTTDVANTAQFTEALIRIRLREGMYQLLENTVSVNQQTLFHTRISLPANLIEGDYRTRIFLTRSGRVTDTYETVIPVNKVGMEQFLYQLAHNRPLIYGVLSLTIAIAAGWLASAAFRLLRR